MWAVLALSATVLTSILPILNKLLLRDARPALVAWAINAASLPLLAMGTLFFTECTIETDRLSLSCSAHWPQIDAVFVAALLGSALLNWAASLLSSHALYRADASLVTPLLTFNPAFTLLVALVVLREIPGLQEVLGVAVILLGANLLEVQEARSGLLAPLLVLLRKPGAALAIVASMLWGATTVLEKLAIEHVRPPRSPGRDITHRYFTHPQCADAFFSSDWHSSSRGTIEAIGGRCRAGRTSSRLSRRCYHCRGCTPLRVYRHRYGPGRLCNSALQTRRCLHYPLGEAFPGRGKPAYPTAWGRYPGAGRCACCRMREAVLHPRNP